MSVRQALCQGLVLLLAFPQRLRRAKLRRDCRCSVSQLACELRRSRLRQNLSPQPRSLLRRLSPHRSPSHRAEECPLCQRRARLFLPGHNRKQPRWRRQRRKQRLPRRLRQNLSPQPRSLLRRLSPHRSPSHRAEECPLCRRRWKFLPGLKQRRLK